MGVEELKIGIIGSGMMGLEHIRNLQAIDGARVVAVADPEPGSLDWARATLGSDDSVAYYADHRTLLDAGDCDAVVVASPNMTHAEVLLDVIEAQVDCLVEKPMCTTIEDCHRIVEASDASSSMVWVGLEYRYMPPIAHGIRLAADGSIGRVRMVAMREHRFPFLTKVGDWNRFNENTGGTLVEKCCHFFDLLGLIAGAEPLRVMASGAQDVNHLNERYDGRTPDILDNALVIIDYANGVRGSLDLCMFAEGSRNQEELSVVGDLGKIEAFLPSGEVRLGSRTGWHDGVTSSIITDDRVAHEGLHHGSSYLEHLDFLEAVRTRSEPLVGVADGLRSVAVGVAAQRSLTEHRVVELVEVL
ncbi:MAG: Gfo/Idh/MocA family oxidoreductase [Actinomycetes bacterium]